MISFNQVISAIVIELGLTGLYRVVAISKEVGAAVLAPIPMESGLENSKRRVYPGVRDFKKISLETLSHYMDIGSINVVEILPDKGLMQIGNKGEKKGDENYLKRLEIMQSFLVHENLAWALFSSQGLGHLVREAQAKFKSSRSSIYKLFSLLCQHGFVASSLHPRYDRCGAPGVLRPCDGNRKKAGRKTNLERISGENGNPQVGVSSKDREKILALYKTLKKPGICDRKVYDTIISLLYASGYRTSAVGAVAEMPAKGTFPNIRQFRHIIKNGFDKLEKIRMSTTTGHYNRNHRGLKGKSWQDIAGPGHTYIIDSTIADIFLVSSVNRAWVCGRPIVYIVVCGWATAIVGFFLCWSGPSWEMAKVALYCSVAGSDFIKEMWEGIEEWIYLDPQPTLPASFLADRGEYLSTACRATATSLGFNLAINPSRRPDLKGMVEVLNRIKKDQQYGFVPGAVDARRKELELRLGSGKGAALTIQEYARYLVNIFNTYNHSADRSHRLDTDMIADRVTPTPAGLWKWGHQVGLGYSKYTPSHDLVTNLLPKQEASVNRTGVHFAGLLYESSMSEREQWTAQARNLGSYHIPIHYFPGSASKIWWPGGKHGLTMFSLSRQARAKPSICFDEWLDALMVDKLQQEDRAYQRLKLALESAQNSNKIIKEALNSTREANLQYMGRKLSLNDAKRLERDLSSRSIAAVEQKKESLEPEFIFKQGSNEHDQLVQEIFSLINSEAGDE